SGEEEGRSMKNEWIFYVALAGLSWGTYVPLIFYGGNELGGKSGARLMAILCVGIAYFVIAVLLPLALFLSKQAEWPYRKTAALVLFSKEEAEVAKKKAAAVNRPSPTAQAPAPPTERPS